MTTVVFDHTTTGYRVPHALCLAHAAKLAYADPDTARRQAGEWGFDRFRFFEAEFAPPFALDHTQGFTMAGDDMVVTAFRGTEPTQIMDWLSDGKAPLVRHSSRRGRVHWGFSTAVDAVYTELRGAVEEFRTAGAARQGLGQGQGYALDAAAFRPDADGITDHFIDAYIACLEAAGR
ncbi:hypothetical protein OUQ99_14685 [Streptomonospora nanhaiensis]|uniref:Uncharacterized protein n=1 Tax=Streptomonospora nanhaiensis TaxID=1323731 RepID=A0ABY6YVM9_9ACTN|nr:hypothetical protein [Streptomonospora nanhaiensis]WAE76248.1 hypothetical protein OUQ99_14685 [Streptomonospora nanhaiensis]